MTSLSLRYHFHFGKGFVFYLLPGARIIIHSSSRFEPISTEPQLKKLNVVRVVEKVYDPHSRPTRTKHDQVRPDGNTFHDQVGRVMQYSRCW